MLQQMKRMFNAQRQDYWIYGCVILGCYLFGVVLLSCILRFSDEDSYFYLGTLLAFIGLALASFLKHGFIGNVEFQLAISMQQVRRHYLAADLVMSLLELAAGYAVVLALYQLEKGLYSWMFSFYTEDGTSAFLFRWQFALPAVAVIVTLSQLCSAIYGRYGAKGFVGIYLGFMALSFGGPRLVHLLAAGSSLGKVGAALSQLPPAAWIAVCAAVLAAIFLISMKLLGKQAVKL